MNKIVFKKGESVTIGFLLNSEYDISRIQSASAWVGGKKFALATIDHMLRCELASDETHKLSGNYKLILWIDDATLGVKKTYAADIEISTNNSNDNNDSTNEGYDFVFNITINETAIQAGDVLYNYVKGDNADLPVGIVIDTNYVHTDNNYDDAAVAEVAKIAGKQDKTDNSLATDDKTVVGAINEVNSIANGANQALAFDNYQAVIAAMLVSGLNDGQNLYVDTLEVPDLWVKSVELTSVGYTYTTDEQFVTDILAGVQIGYYKLALLETQKVDLTNYYTKSESDFNYEPKNSNIQTHIGTTGNPHSTTIDDMTSGAATTVASGDSFFLKVGNLWKTITETNWLTWFRDLPHTFTQLITFSGNLKTTKIIPNSDTTGVVIRNAADSADVVKVDTATGVVTSYLGGFQSIVTGTGGKSNTSYAEFVAYNPGNNYPRATFLVGQTTNDINVGLTVSPKYGRHQTILGVATERVFSPDWRSCEILQSDSYASIHALSNKGNSAGTPMHFSTQTYLGNNPGICIGNTAAQFVGIGHAFPETKLDINGTTTHRDWTYFNNGTHTGDAVGDIRMKNISGVLTFYRCTVGNTTKGSGTWEQIHTIG